MSNGFDKEAIQRMAEAVIALLPSPKTDPRVIQVVGAMYTTADKLLGTVEASPSTTTKEALDYLASRLELIEEVMTLLAHDRDQLRTFVTEANKGYDAAQSK